MINQNYKLTFNTQQVKPKVIVSEGDDGLRQINFILDDTPTSAIVKIGNNTITSTLSGNIISFVVTSAISVLGKYEGEVVADGMRTLNFDFIVESTPI